MLLRCNTPAVIVFVPLGSAHCREASQKLDFCFTRRLNESLCSTVRKPKSLKNRVRKMHFFSPARGTYKNIFRADVVDVQCFRLFTDLLKVHQRCFFLNEHLHKRHKFDTDGFAVITGFFGVESLIADIFTPKNMSVIASTDFETCVSCSKIGGLRIDDVNCQTVTGSPKYCMKALQSLFSLVTGAHETTASRIRRSHNYRVRSVRSSFVPQVLEQKRDCSQSSDPLVMYCSLAVLDGAFTHTVCYFLRCKEHRREGSLPGTVIPCIYTWKDTILIWGQWNLLTPNLYVTLQTSFHCLSSLISTWMQTWMSSSLS